MILCKQDLEDAVSDFEDGILDPAFDDNDSFMHEDDYEDIFGALGQDGGYDDE